MRPRYETKDDRHNESVIAGKIQSGWNCTLHKTPYKCPYDFVSEVGGKLTSLIEIKQRSNDFLKYDTYMISADKIIQCTNASDVLGVPFYLVVQFTDSLMWWEHKKQKLDVRLGGRKDRGDSQDVEPVIHIDTWDFYEVRGS